MRLKRKQTGDGVKSILDLASEHATVVHAAHAANGKDALKTRKFKKDVYESPPIAPEKPVVGTGNFSKKVVSESIGVHPDQIEELRALNKTLGTEVEIDNRGRPVFDNSQQMRKYAKARGWRHYGY